MSITSQHEVKFYFVSTFIVGIADVCKTLNRNGKPKKQLLAGTKTFQMEATSVPVYRSSVRTVLWLPVLAVPVCMEI